MGFDVAVPQYYVVSRTLTTDQAALVVSALRITPIFCAIITDLLDCPLAFKLANEVIRADSTEEAHNVARKIGSQAPRPPLIVGEADLLDAVYADGRKETVACAN